MLRPIGLAYADRHRGGAGASSVEDSVVAGDFHGVDRLVERTPFSDFALLPLLRGQFFHHLTFPHTKSSVASPCVFGRTSSHMGRFMRPEDHTTSSSSPIMSI
jgi:hypothetical protein